MQNIFFLMVEAFLKICDFEKSYNRDRIVFGSKLLPDSE